MIENSINKECLPEYRIAGRHSFSLLSFKEMDDKLNGAVLICFLGAVRPDLTGKEAAEECRIWKIITIRK